MAPKKETVAKNRKAKSTMPNTLVYGIVAVLLIALIIGASVLIGKGSVQQKTNLTTATPVTSTSSNVNLTCTTFKCENPTYNSTTGILSIDLTQSTGYNWTNVNVRFVPQGTNYSSGVPVLSWTPPQAMSVNGTWFSNSSEYVHLPTAFGTVAPGTNLTGSIWAKYQLNIGGTVYYANISSAVITVMHNS